jgi:hypothetical protein
MIKFLTTFFLVMTGFSAFSQTWLLETRGKTAGHFIIIEDKLGSTPVKKGLYIGKPGLAQPICFRRKESGFPDLMITYYFYKSDSVIDNIEYNWNEINFKETINYEGRKSPAEMIPYVKKYQDIYSGIKDRYGEGKIEGNLDTSAIASDQFKLETEAKWQLKDSSKLKLSIYLSNKYTVSGNVSVYPQYNIKLTITNPSRPDNGTDESRLSDEKIHELDSVYKMFLIELKNDDIDSARTRLSPLLTNKVTNAQLTGLKNLLRLNESSVVFMSGMQIFMDGSTGIMLQYKYESDKGTPPSEMVKVIFDRTGKILGIQPMKRM